MIINVKKVAPFFKFEQGEEALNTLPSSRFFPFFRFKDENGKDVVGSCLFTSKGRFFIQQEESWYEIQQSSTTS